jgi:hypothetical protein
MILKKVAGILSHEHNGDHFYRKTMERNVRELGRGPPLPLRDRSWGVSSTVRLMRP